MPDLNPIQLLIFEHTGRVYPLSGGDGHSYQNAIIIETTDPTKGVDILYQLIEYFQQINDAEYDIESQDSYIFQQRRYHLIHVVTKSNDQTKTLTYYFDITHFQPITDEELDQDIQAAYQLPEVFLHPPREFLYHIELQYLLLGIVYLIGLSLNTFIYFNFSTSGTLIALINTILIAICIYLFTQIWNRYQYHPKIVWGMVITTMASWLLLLISASIYADAQQHVPILHPVAYTISTIALSLSMGGIIFGLIKGVAYTRDQHLQAKQKLKHKPRTPDRQARRDNHLLLYFLIIFLFIWNIVLTSIIAWTDDPTDDINRLKQYVSNNARSLQDLETKVNFLENN